MVCPSGIVDIALPPLYQREVGVDFADMGNHELILKSTVFPQGVETENTCDKVELGCVEKDDLYKNLGKLVMGSTSANENIFPKMCSQLHNLYNLVLVFSVQDWIRNESMDNFWLLISNSYKLIFLFF